MLSANFKPNKNSNKGFHESQLFMPLNLPDNKYLPPIKYIRLTRTFRLKFTIL